MPTRASWLVVAVLIGTAGRAHALKPGTHAEIARSRCIAAGLPTNFCQRVATENYVTDSREWEDLRAHAQIDSGETACVAADRTAERMWQLGDELRRDLVDIYARPHDDNVGAAANALGRALHTIQDNCAHAGMPNPQHAWFSLSDFCLDTELSPDIQSDAASCARTETDALVQLVATAVRTAELARSLELRSCPTPSSDRNNETPVCQRRFLPGPIDACRFLATAKDWDGMDRTWDNGVVAAALRTSFAAGFAGEPMLASICGGNESMLSPAVSEPVVDIAVGTPSCGKASLLCLGKVDDADNPFFDHDHDGLDEHASESAGCSTSGRSGAGLLVLITGALFARRRRSAR